MWRPECGTVTRSSMRNVGLREKNAREKRKNANVVRVLDGSTWTMRIGVTAFKFIVLKKRIGKEKLGGHWAVSISDLVIIDDKCVSVNAQAAETACFQKSQLADCNLAVNYAQPEKGQWFIEWI